MLRLISISTWLTIAWGLQPGLEYRYRYNGRLATGITEMRHQFAAVGIQADLTLQVASDHSFVAKFDHIEVGDFHDDHNCDLRMPIPIVYKSLEEGKVMLQRPFRVSLKPEDASYIEVGSDEPSWITNIRKSVVNILPFASLWGEIQESKGEFVRTNFGKKEQLIGGRCTNWYSATRMQDEKVARINQEMTLNVEEDVQHGGASSASAGVPTLHDDLWTVTRTVDYERCHHLVELKYNGNKQSDKVISRTSIAHYVIRGNKQGFRLEKAMVEGGLSVSTGNNSHEHIDTFTNQTLELRSVKLISSQMEIDYETQRHHSWQYQVNHVSSTKESPDFHRSLKEILTGVQTTAEEYETIKKTLYLALDDMEAGADNFVVAMDTVVKCVSSLSYGQLESVQEHINGSDLLERDRDWAVREAYERKLYNLRAAAVLAGTEASVRFAIQKMIGQTASYPSEDNYYELVFKLIPSTLKTPSSIPSILDMLVINPKIRRGNYIEFSLFLTSLSSMAGKYCMSSDRRSAYHDSFSTEESMCDPDEVTQKFIPHLQKNIQNPSYPVEYREWFIQALVNLGTPLSINILEPIILGTSEESPSFRVTAMSALSAHLLPSTAREMVLRILMPMMENQGEDPLVRNMAFLILLSWKPGPTWWKSRAISTWHEPSTQVMNFVSSTIQSIAESRGEMSEMASQALYLTKPAQAISISHSSSFYLNNILNSDYPDREISIILFSSMDGLLPDYIFIKYMLHRLHGYSSPSKIKLNKLNLDFGLMHILKQYLPQADQINTDDFMSEYLKSKKEEFGLPTDRWPISPKVEITFNDVIRFFRVMYLWEDKTFYELMLQFSEYVPSNFDELFYNKDIDSTIAYPTDLGIPFLVQYSAQSALRAVKPNSRGIPRHPDFLTRWRTNFKFNLQISQETSVKTRTMVPWMKSSVGSGISSEIDIQLPITIHVGAFVDSRQVVIRVEAAEQTQKPLVRAHNHPYTAVYRGLIPSQYVDENEYMIIHRSNRKSFSDSHRVAPWTGFWLESSWEGDFELPSWKSILSGQFSFMAPSHNNWEYNITYDSTSTTTKQITVVLSYDSATKNADDVSDLRFESPEWHYADYPNDYYGYGEDEVIDKETLKEFMEDTLQRIHQIHSQVASGDVVSVGARAIVEGSNKDSREVIFTSIKDKFGERVNTTYKMKIFEEVPHDPASKAHLTCLDVGIEAPNFLPLASAEDVLKMDFSFSVNLELHTGTSCAGTPLRDIQGTFRVSERHMQAVKEKLENNCDYNQDYPAKDIITSQLNDEGHLKIHWTEEIPDSLKPFVSSYNNFLDRYFINTETCDYMPVSSSSTIDIKAYRDLHSSHANAHALYPGRNCSYVISLPPFVGVPTSQLDSFVHHRIYGQNPAICSISNTKVHTFDGKNYPFTPNNCWKIGTWETFDNSFILQVRYTHEWEAKVIWKERGLLFDMTKSDVKINSDWTPEHRYKIITQHNAKLLTLSNGIAVKVSDKVEIQMIYSYRTTLGGLCGDYNDEVTYDLKGPKGCAYIDPELFVASWEAAGEVCDESSHRERKQKVDQFQISCSNKTYINTGMSHEIESGSCLTWKYQQKTEGNCICKSLAPIKVCESGCVASSTTQKSIPFDCHRADSGVENDCHIQHFLIDYPQDCKQN